MIFFFAIVSNFRKRFKSSCFVEICVHINQVINQITGTEKLLPTLTTTSGKISSYYAKKRMKFSKKYTFRKKAFIPKRATELLIFNPFFFLLTMPFWARRPTAYNHFYHFVSFYRFYASQIWLKINFGRNILNDKYLLYTHERSNVAKTEIYIIKLISLSENWINLKNRKPIFAHVCIINGSTRSSVKSDRLSCMEGVRREKKVAEWTWYQTWFNQMLASLNETID